MVIRTLISKFWNNIEFFIKFSLSQGKNFRGQNSCDTKQHFLSTISKKYTQNSQRKRRNDTMSGPSSVIAVSIAKHVAIGHGHKSPLRNHSLFQSAGTWAGLFQLMPKWVESPFRLIPVDAFLGGPVWAVMTLPELLVIPAERYKLWPPYSRI